MGKAENEIESYLTQKAKENGFICMKFTSPENNGVSDRLLVGHGSVFFVEVKAPGEKPRPLQVKFARSVWLHGCRAHTVDTKDRVDALLSEYIKRKKDLSSMKKDMALYGVHSIRQSKKDKTWRVDGDKGYRIFSENAGSEKEIKEFYKNGR